MPRLAYLYALAAIVLWSTLALISVKLARVPPLLLVGCALTIGGLCSAHRIREWRVPWTTLALGIYGLFVYHLCLFVALRLAPPVEANLLNYLWPLLIVLLTPLVLPGSRLTARQVIAGMVGFAGAGLVVTGGALRWEALHLAGDALAALAALIWSTYSLLLKRVRPFPSSAVGLFCVVSGCLSFLAHLAWEPSYRLQSGELAWVLALGVGPMGAAFFLWDAAMKRGDSRIIGSLAYLTPLLSTSLLVTFGNGQFVPTTAIGMAAIVVAAILGASGARA